VVTENGPKIIRINDVINVHTPQQALQSRPILLYSGKPDGADSHEARANRSIIGVTQEGNIVVALVLGEARQSITLAETADLLVSFASLEGRPKLSDVLALDGGPSAHLYAPRSKRHFGSTEDGFVPNIICFERK
jgi:uncharacterized protein YigE (DUF2233 family)